MVPIISTTEGNARPAYFFLRGVIKGFERETKGGREEKKKKESLELQEKNVFISSVSFQFKPLKE